MIEQAKISNLDSRRDTKNLAITYAKVFSGPPWNEYTKCSIDGRFFGLDTIPGGFCKANCSPCKGVLEPAYPETETIAYIQDEMSKPNSVARIIKAKNEILAFAWGFSLESPDIFAEEKYKTAEMRNIISDLLRQSGISDSFFYFSEFGVANKYRGRGWSNDLFTELNREAQKLQLSILMRTNQESPMIAVAEKFGMTQILGPQVRVDRVARRFLISDQIVNGCQDLENSNRILFILPNE